MQVAPAEAWAVVGEEMEAAPRGQAMERAYEGTVRGSVEFLGRWNENKKNRAMPLKFRADEDADGTGVRVGFGRFIDALVRQGGASSGILAISTWVENRGDAGRFTVRGFAWSASPDDASYQRHGFVGASTKHGNIRFADFEGVVDDFGALGQMAVYRVTLPSGGLDLWKWAGRPPPPAPEDLYTGPRSDGLLSTDEVSGEYSAACICVNGLPMICNSMTVVPHGPDAIETWRTCCQCFLCLCAPLAGGEVRTRNPGTNAFGDMTFSADGTASKGFKKRPTSQKRAFQKVETRGLAGKWCGCWCNPFCFALSCFYFTTKRALNEDQYEEEGCYCPTHPPFLLCPVGPTTHTRKYVNGHATNGFADNSGGDVKTGDVHWHRDPGCAGKNSFFAKKAG